MSYAWYALEVAFGGDALHELLREGIETAFSCS